MNSYPSLIGGAPALADTWSHGICAESFLEDIVGNLRIKRELDAGQRTDWELCPTVFGRSGVATEQQIKDAFTLAGEAFNDWSLFPLEERMVVAEEFHKSVLANTEMIGQTLILEGHPKALIDWEIAGMLHATSPESMQLMASHMFTEQLMEDRRILHIRRPDGVVVFSPPQNAAAANSVGGVAILVAGNTLVIQAPRSVPFGVMRIWTELISPILERIGAPAGTLSVVCADTKSFLELSLDSPSVNDIVYFGGSERGLQLGIDAVTKGKKPVLELAGNDGCLVWHDAKLDGAVAALAENFMGSGQICMVPKYAIAHPDIADEVIGRLSDVAAAIRPGLPSDEHSILTPILRSDEFFRVLEESLAAGAELITGGSRIDLSGDEDALGPFVQPTVLRVDGLELADSLECVRSETFFPLLPIVVPNADDENLLAEIIDFMNQNRYGLRNSAWANDPAVIKTLVASLRNSGILKINESHVGFVPHLGSHGGPGMTGGPFGELNYPHLRTTHLQGISIGSSDSNYQLNATERSGR